MMKKIIVVLSTLLLTGCFAIVPVTQKFPQAPSSLQKPCPELDQLPQTTTKLSDTLTVVTQNYGKYHLCSAKVEAWIEWYNEQKSIYNRFQ